jgi:hypothetical protein
MVNMMEKRENTFFEEIQGTAREILSQIKKLIQEGNTKRVILQNKKGKVLFQSQLSIGAAGATFFVIYAPILTAITAVLLAANDVTVLVERVEDEDDLHDEYEVDADVIEISDEEEESTSDKKTKK